jgi:hypothetical protein
MTRVIQVTALTQIFPFPCESFLPRILVVLVLVLTIPLAAFTFLSNCLADATGKIPTLAQDNLQTLAKVTNIPTLAQDNIQTLAKMDNQESLLLPV